MVSDIGETNDLMSELVVQLEADNDELRTNYENIRYEKDLIIAILTKCFPAVLAPHASDESGWDRGWGWVVYLKLPTGQVSWHIDDDHKMWFDHLEISNINPWDKHDTDEKWRRVAAFLERKE